MTGNGRGPSARETAGYDVVVIGGAAAGLAGALTLARARRSVLVLDAGAPRNRFADGVHALFGLDGIAPAELFERGRADVLRYGGQIESGEVVRAHRTEAGFEVTTAEGRTVRARRLLVTTGLVDELPDIPGVRERWGRDVVHCPYCHGWEVRDQPIAVLATGAHSIHQAQLFRQWSEDIVLFTHTTEPPAADKAEELAARGVRVVPGEIAGVVVEDDKITGVRLVGGEVVARTTVVVAPRMMARAEFLADLGLYPVEHPSGAGTHIPADPMGGATAVDGVWVAGNITDPAAQVGPSAAAGANAAARINADLVVEDTATAVEAARRVRQPI
ncbi:NAD(P)/FAD-dependent oxidoreductase [Nocardia higoensis]|uniref:NAD(P)/FAD-dependent oxidoreductase n=1 Tax=Nocardia higoensis TaxID=228599 RepID=A0ABS0D9C9_9NOCA|nr:NAD(P)/FAD-dependent oxidoreductase [Nocardia higoensis]MBF6355069.1 NAD(P)/FAD-dependent oxidoreductase [Nocardia higoensis]